MKVVRDCMRSMLLLTTEADRSAVESSRGDCLHSSPYFTTASEKALKTSLESEVVERGGSVKPVTASTAFTAC